MSTSPEPREFNSSTEALFYLKRKAASAKAHDLRERFANEILMIRNKKQTHTSHSVPPGTQPVYFSKLEGNGVWEKVCEDLNDLSDVTSAYFASDVFRGHLEEKRILMLLPQVFRILQNDGYIYVYSPNLDVQHLRLVSKAWKEAAEEQFLSPSVFSQSDWHLQHFDLNYGMTVWPPFVCKFKLDRNEDDGVDTAMNVLRHSQSCSALLRVVDIYITVNHNAEYLPMRGDFFTKLGQFFDLYGTHVWALHFSTRFDYENLCQLVSRMPNLKELYLGNWNRDFGLWGNEENERMLIARFPFPTVSSLTRLSINYICYYKLLTAEIIQRNPSLKTISVADGRSSSMMQLFSVLSNLRLECFRVNFTGERDRMNLNHIQPLGRMDWPLKILSLTRDEAYYDRVTLNGSDFFGILNQFNVTLEEINLDSVMLSDDGRSVVVQFPKLRKVSKVWAEV